MSLTAALFEHRLLADAETQLDFVRLTVRWIEEFEGQRRHQAAHQIGDDVNPNVRRLYHLHDHYAESDCGIKCSAGN
jgi:hypothetical protein